MPLSFSVREIADWVGARIVNADSVPGLTSAKVTKPAELAGSREGDIAYFFSKAYQSELLSAAPTALVTGEDFVVPLEKAGLPLWKKSAVLACKDPYLAMAEISARFADLLSSTAHVGASKGGIHPTSVVQAGAKVAADATIGPHCVIEEGVTVGSGTVIYAGCYLGKGASVGERSVLFAGVRVYERVRIGNRVRIHSGTVIGADGFGYAPRTEKGAVVGHQKIHHFGSVVIGDDVEIGANTCIDRGTLGDTRIDRLVKIDNLVQIGHNVHLAEGAVVCGAAAIAGSASVGKFAYIGGGGGLCNQVHVGDGAKVGAMALVSKDVAPGENAVGNPQRSSHEHFRAHAMLNKLARKGGESGRK